MEDTASSTILKRLCAAGMGKNAAVSADDINKALRKTRLLPSLTSLLLKPVKAAPGAVWKTTKWMFGAPPTLSNLKAAGTAINVARRGDALASLLPGAYLRYRLKRVAAKNPGSGMTSADIDNYVDRFIQGRKFLVGAGARAAAVGGLYAGWNRLDDLLTDISPAHQQLKQKTGQMQPQEKPAPVNPLSEEPGVRGSAAF